MLSSLYDIRPFPIITTAFHVAFLFFSDAVVQLVLTGSTCLSEEIIRPTPANLILGHTRPQDRVRDGLFLRGLTSISSSPKCHADGFSGILTWCLWQAHKAGN